VTPHEEDLIVSIYALFYFVKGRYNFLMKPKTYVFLFIIITILTFILGVRYGQRVEKANKAVDYLLSITPSLTPKISPISPTVKESTTTPKILLKEKVYVP